MATVTTVILNPHFTYNSVEWTDQVRQITLPFSLEELDALASGVGARVKVPGLEVWSMTISVHRNFGTGSIDASLWAAKEAEKPPSGVASTWTVKRQDAAVSISNPSYTGSGYIQSFPIASGAVGALDIIDVVIMAASTITRSTSA